jgi:hypothetical protein
MQEILPKTIAPLASPADAGELSRRSSPRQRARSRIVEVNGPHTIDICDASNPHPIRTQKKKARTGSGLIISFQRAGHGIRTRDFDLGKLDVN